MNGKGATPDKTYEFIQASIRDGVFRPGEFLREGQLAEMIGVSRTPVREALRRLGAEGFVKTIPNRGVQVAVWSEDDVKLIFDLRLRLEGYAARVAARTIDDEGLARLTGFAVAMERLLPRWRSSIKEITTLNNRFHRAVIESSSNPILAANVASIVQLALVLHTYQGFSDDDMKRSMHHHRELTDALSYRDPDWAESVMRLHLLSARRILFPAESSHEEPRGEQETPAS